VAEEAMTIAGQQAQEASSPLRVVVRPLWFGAVLAVLLAITLGILGSSLEVDAREASQAVDVERAGIPSNADIQKTMMAYRDLRSREVAIDARFAYVSELFKNRVAWHQVFNTFDSALPKGMLSITSVEMQVSWPNTGEDTKGNVRRSKAISFRLKGDARSMTGVTGFNQALKQAPFIKDSRIASHRPGSARPGGGGGSAYTFEIVGEVDDAQSQAN
jgi:hypothetical protein